MANRIKILIVDDEPNALKLLHALLSPEGYEVFSAPSGAAALAIALKEIPDLVLLDVMMPDMDGFEVCATLRADSRLSKIPVLMLTALDDRASLLKGLSAGADDFITKPFDSVELRARLRTITRLNRFRQLYEEQALLETAVNHAPYGIVLAKPDGTILQRNSAFTQLLGPEHANETNLFACLPDTVARGLREAQDSSLGYLAPVETALNPAINPTAVVEISGAVVPWRDRRVMQYFVRDITRRKLLEQQLAHSQRIELLGQLAGGAIHDVNNLLTAIYGNAQLLEMKQGADLKVHLDHILTSTQRGATMLRQLLMFARGEDGTLEPADPAGVAAEVAFMVKETFGRSYRVDFHAAPQLPNIAVDATQIHQIVMNLCVNARDAMPQGGILDIGVERRSVDANVKAVLAETPAAGDYICISVRDNGTGIPPSVLPKLFDPFFTTKPKGKGTGLGLATVIRLVRRHKGFVTLETEVGKGTCFNCFFPVGTAAAAAS